jgi:hypothetical protein
LKRKDPAFEDNKELGLLGFRHTVAMFINLAVGLSIAYLTLLELWLTHYGPSPEKA